MNLIKLDAIDSTNDYLKNLAKTTNIDNFTVVVAKHQTQGRGQMGATWNSEIGKNLIMSVLIKDALTNSAAVFDLNIAIALALIAALKEYNLPKLSIKWPNDIMSDNKKIGGILIENSFKSDNTIESVVGIGLNVNQTSFENLPKATSMALEMQVEFDLDLVLKTVFDHIETQCDVLLLGQTPKLWEAYHDNLYKIKTPMPFETANQNRFMGIIQGVTKDGQLQILLENDTLQNFGIKAITMLY